MRLIDSLLLISALTLIGCSHGLTRGPVAMKTSDNEAHVCLGDKEVKVGDRVSAFNNFCPGMGGGRKLSGGGGICEKQSIGDGTVTELLNQHYSVVKFAEGTLVETKCVRLISSINDFRNERGLYVFK